ncbi:MAG TPA: NlpC/P60 family protein [Chitinophagaceae bacterium]|nr:NlpC/P60 family protein [Chitinophagaceae bacterium]
MLRKLLPVMACAVVLASCSSMKPLAFNKQTPATTNTTGKKEIKFLDIASTDNTIQETKKESHSSGAQAVKTAENNSYTSKSADIESVSSLQLKYSVLLNTEVEQVQNIPLYQNIDDWYGTPYKLGGYTKNGIDCSAFVQTIFVSAFGITLPRTAKEQYTTTRRISRTELQEGDLLFFNTRGGVSHVGIYLQNNKFVHASISGVMISDMFEPYYVKHFIAAGRVESKVPAFQSSRSISR